MIRAEVRKILKEGTDKVEAHGLFIGDREIGRTKLECDAQMSMHAINEAMDINEVEAEQASYDRGYTDGFADGEASI